MPGTPRGCATCLELPGRPRALARYSIRELFALSWQLYRRQLDLYHSTHYVLPAWVGSKVVVTIHDIIHLLYPEFLPNNLAFLYAQRMLRRSLTRGDRIIAVSQNTKADLIQQFEVHARKINVVHNGVEDTFRRKLPESELQRWLRELGIARPTSSSRQPRRTEPHLVKAFARAEAGLVRRSSSASAGRQGTEYKIPDRGRAGWATRWFWGRRAGGAAAICQGRPFLYPPSTRLRPAGWRRWLRRRRDHVQHLGPGEIGEGYAHLVDPGSTWRDGARHAATGDADHRASLSRPASSGPTSSARTGAARRALDIALRPSRPRTKLHAAGRRDGRMTRVALV
jgi:glycosyltransferase involved in cell wall biosynthesis